jgi:chemotaxis methyl-accepting protein methylase
MPPDDRSSPSGADIAAAAEAPMRGYDAELERIEIRLLLEGIYRHYGFDFRSYAYASLRRRIWKRIAAERLTTISALQDRVLHEPAMMERLLLDLSINVTAMYDGALFAPRLMRNIVFSQHNLVTDRSFAECNVILCRNVLIYFDRTLQQRVHKLFYESLPVYGYLGLGSKESLRFTGFEDHYEQVDRREKIYRKVR